MIQGKDPREQQKLAALRRHNMERALAKGQRLAKEHNRAVAELAEQCRKLESTVYCISGPVSQFLVQHSMMKEGEKMPLADELYQLLVKTGERIRQIAIVEAGGKAPDA